MVNEKKYHLIKLFIENFFFHAILCVCFLFFCFFFCVNHQKCRKIIHHMIKFWDDNSEKKWRKTILILFTSHVKSLSCSIQCTSGLWWSRWTANQPNKDKDERKNVSRVRKSEERCESKKKVYFTNIFIAYSCDEMSTFICIIMDFTQWSGERKVGRQIKKRTSSSSSSTSSH